MKTYADVDEWLAQRTVWRDEVSALRDIVLGTGLAETIKWGQPCYTDNERNILLMSHRKDFAVLSYLRGALLRDPQGLLVSPGENSRSSRYLRFEDVAQVREQQAYIETLIAQAIELARSGIRVEPLPDEIAYCEELQQRLDADDDFRTAFEALTRGRRRYYNMHFSQAKASTTRESRIDRCTERILQGKGLQDCICGHSKRMPRCDGSHKHFA